MDVSEGEDISSKFHVVSSIMLLHTTCMCHNQSLNF